MMSISRSSRIVPPHELLFKAAGAGDLDEVKRVVELLDDETIRNLTSKSNDEGDTIYHIAARRQDEVMVAYLLDNVRNVLTVIYDILLLSITESNEEIVNMLLNAIDTHEDLEQYKVDLSSLPRWENSQFEHYITPMMLAATTGNYQVISILGNRGETVLPRLRPRPMQIKGDFEDFCCCCLRRGKYPHSEVIAHDYQRLHEFEATTSPELLCYYANKDREFDPLLKAFDYIKELQDIQEYEIELRQRYAELIKKLQDFAIQLVAMCENPVELNLLLSRQEGFEGTHDKYPRVVMALEMEFREFVAHPNVQGTLYTQWAGDDWFQWRYLSTCEKIREFMCRLIFIPLYLLFICGEQGNKQGRMLASPISRCIHACISQIVFVGLAITEQILELSQPRIRTPSNMYIEMMMAVFVVGQCRALLRQFCVAPAIFFKQAWNWYDLITYSLFMGCFACWGLIYFRRENISEFHQLYQPSEREKWDYADVLLVADSFLSLATAMAVGKLLRFIQLSSSIGPVQIALGKMLKKIFHFIPLFVIVDLSFTLALTSLYAPYSAINEKATNETHTFGSNLDTLHHMFWDKYAMTEVTSPMIRTWIKVNSTREDQYHYEIVELAGKILFSVHDFFGAAILFGCMLVGYISNTFGEIIDENDINWKFSRAELWIYFSRASVMPPPLNLFPAFWDIIHFFRTIQQMKKNPQKVSMACSCAACLHATTKLTLREKEEYEEKYHDFIKSLTRRYFRRHALLEEESTPTEEDVVTISEEMQELETLLETALASCRECMKKCDTWRVLSRDSPDPLPQSSPETRQASQILKPDNLTSSRTSAEIQRASRGSVPGQDVRAGNQLTAAHPEVRSSHQLEENQGNRGSKPSISTFPGSTSQVKPTTSGAFPQNGRNSFSRRLSEQTAGTVRSGGVGALSRITRHSSSPVNTAQGSVTQTNPPTRTPPRAANSGTLTKGQTPSAEISQVPPRNSGTGGDVVVNSFKTNAGANQTPASRPSNVSAKAPNNNQGTHLRQSTASELGNRRRSSAAVPATANGTSGNVPGSSQRPSANDPDGAACVRRPKPPLPPLPVSSNPSTNNVPQM